MVSGSIPGQANLQINFFSFFSFSSYRNHQTFLIRLATFKITQILSPERTSERKGMSTVKQFIWVNLYSLDLNSRLWGLLVFVYMYILSKQRENGAIKLLLNIHFFSKSDYTLKSLLHTNVLNDVTAAPFSVSFSQLPAVKKHQKWCSCDVIKDVRT